MSVAEIRSQESVLSVVGEQIVRGVITDSDSEQRLLERVRDDLTAFWPLWQHYQPVLYKCCLKWTKNLQDAEDLLSEVMFKARALLPHHVGKVRNLQAWLIRLAQNYCLDWQRQQTRLITNHQKLQHALQSAVVAPLLPSQVLENDEMCKSVRGAIAVLPTSMRDVAILRILEQKSTIETARQLNISVELVRQRMQRARHLLEKPIKQYLMGEEAQNAADGKRVEYCDQAASFGKVSIEEPLAVSQAVPEISATVVTISLIPVTLPNGIEMFFHLPWRVKASRSYQKLPRLREYVENHPTGWVKRLELAELLVAIGNWQEAIELYELLVRQRGEIDIYLQLGQLLHLQGQNSEAIAVYQDALEVAKLESTRHHLHGLIATCRWQPKRARNAFEAAVEHSPDNAAHLHALGLSRLQAGYVAEANDAFLRALQLNPNDLLALTYSCQALALEGKVKEAEERARKIIKLDPANILVLKELIDIRTYQRLVSGSEGKETKRLIRRAQKIGASDTPDMQNARAGYHISRGESAQALNILRTTAYAHPNSPTAWYHYARWLFCLGKRQTAIDYMLKAYALAPNDLIICRALCSMLPVSSPLWEEIVLRLSDYWRI